MKVLREKRESNLTTNSHISPEYITLTTIYTVTAPMLKGRQLNFDLDADIFWFQLNSCREISQLEVK